MIVQCKIWVNKRNIQLPLCLYKKTTVQQNTRGIFGRANSRWRVRRKPYDSHLSVERMKNEQELEMKHEGLRVTKFSGFIFLSKNICNVLWLKLKSVFYSQHQHHNAHHQSTRISIEFHAHACAMINWKDGIKIFTYGSCSIRVYDISPTNDIGGWDKPFRTRRICYIKVFFHICCGIKWLRINSNYVWEFNCCHLQNMN